MMAAVVWLDLEKAKLFLISEEKMKRETFKAKRVDHHTHRRENDEKDCVVMYEEVISHLNRLNKILILGPGVAKHHFLKRLEERHPQLAKNVVGCEVSDHPTDQQIAAYAAQYFQRPTFR